MHFYLFLYCCRKESEIESLKAAIEKLREKLEHAEEMAKESQEAVTQ